MVVLTRRLWCDQIFDQELVTLAALCGIRDVVAWVTRIRLTQFHAGVLPGHTELAMKATP